MGWEVAFITEHLKAIRKETSILLGSFTIAKQIWLSLGKSLFQLSPWKRSKICRKRCLNFEFELFLLHFFICFPITICLKYQVCKREVKASCSTNFEPFSWRYLTQWIFERFPRFFGMGKSSNRNSVFFFCHSKVLCDESNFSWLSQHWIQEEESELLRHIWEEWLQPFCLNDIQSPTIIILKCSSFFFLFSSHCYLQNRTCF